MSRIRFDRFALLVIAFLVTALLPLRAVAADSDNDEIRSLIERYRSAANAMDVKAVLTCYALTDSLVIYDVSNAPFRGAPGVTKTWTDFIAAMRSINLELRDIEIEVTPNAEFAFGLFIERANVVTNDGSVAVYDRLRTTHIYRKIAGRWLIVHEHKSKSLSE